MTPGAVAGVVAAVRGGGGGQRQCGEVLAGRLMEVTVARLKLGFWFAGWGDADKVRRCVGLRRHRAVRQTWRRRAATICLNQRWVMAGHLVATLRCRALCRWSPAMGRALGRPIR
jgi:hypothetical protein